LASFEEPGPRMRLASFGETVRGLAQVVDRYELSKSSTRKDSSFIIGGRRERVREIR
jgi:hypothetical protein